MTTIIHLSPGDSVLTTLLNIANIYGMPMVASAPQRISPGAARGVVELVIAVLGVTKWPLLGVSGLAGWLAYQRLEEQKEFDGIVMAFWMACCVFLGLFLGGLAAGGD